MDMRIFLNIITVQQLLDVLLEHFCASNHAARDAALHGRSAVQNTFRGGWGYVGRGVKRDRRI